MLVGVADDPELRPIVKGCPNLDVWFEPASHTQSFDLQRLNRGSTCCGPARWIDGRTSAAQFAIARRRCGRATERSIGGNSGRSPRWHRGMNIRAVYMHVRP
jgi:hypothetical protein